MSNAASNLFQEVDFFEEMGFLKEDKHALDGQSLASFLGIKQKDLAEIFSIDASGISRNGIDVQNKVAQQWLKIFNLLSNQIHLTEPELPKDKAKQKISRWLKIPSQHFGQEAPLDMMKKGRARKVLSLLEQITSPKE